LTGLGSRLVCAGCGAEAPPEEPRPFACPAAAPGDDVDHVMTRVLDLQGTRFPGGGDESPFVRFRELLHSWRTARRRGMDDEAFVERVRALDRAVAAAPGEGRGFRITPYARCDELAGELGIRGLWIKDETGNVAGSHKARHLMGIALWLEVVERTGLAPREGAGPRLAVASCGNAALAAAVVARAADRRLDAYVPVDAAGDVLERLESLGARLLRCERSPGGPPGDPCTRAFREALSAGALPFTCQGSENGLCIEGGETLSWELVSQHAAACDQPLDVIAIQVGGGALASACAQALREACQLSALDRLPRICAVQAAGAHPLHRAWRGVAEGLAPPAADERSDAELAARVRESADRDALERQLARAASHRSRHMWPWEETPRSIATGILDDETYDWLAVVRAMLETGGWPVVVSEAGLARARQRAREATGIDVGATGAAGLAGLLELAHRGALAPTEHAAVLLTGVRR